MQGELAERALIAPHLLTTTSLRRNEAQYYIFIRCREISAAYLVVCMMQASSLRQLKADSMQTRVEARGSNGFPSCYVYFWSNK
jgi:hypothetical protein